MRKIIIFILCITLVGCAGLQRKFIRKKKEEPKPLPITEMYDYKKELRVDELYKKHFLFWKSWQGELIDKMDWTYKKRTECYEGLLENLAEMKKYLKEEKAKELDPFIEELAAIDAKVRKKRLVESEKYRMRQLLERTKRQIEKRFSYSDVKDYLELRR